MALCEAMQCVHTHLLDGSGTMAMGSLYNRYIIVPCALIASQPLPPAHRLHTHLLDVRVPAAEILEAVDIERQQCPSALGIATLSQL